MPSKKPKPTKSGSSTDLPPEKLSATDWAILKHISLYHFTIRHAVQELFFNSERDKAAKAGTALDVLARQGYLKNQEDSKPSQKQTKKTNKSSKEGNQSIQSDGSEVFKMGSIKYYLLGPRSKLLSPRGFKFPKERLVPPSTGQSLYKHLAALWYCIFDSPRRYRLDQEEMAQLWADTIPGNRKVPHQPAFCLANEDHGPVIYRLYPTQKSKAAQIVDEVRKKLEQDINNLSLQRWIDAGKYGYAIIVPSQDRKQEVERELAKLSDQNALLSAARLTVHKAPPPPLLAKALKERGDGGQSQHLDIRPLPNSPASDSQLQEPPTDEPPEFYFTSHT